MRRDGKGQSAASASGFGPAFDAEYDALPEALKMVYTPRDYAWLPPERRATLIEEETMPEAYPED